MENANYKEMKARLEEKFDQLNLDEFKPSKEYFYETLMNRSAFRSFFLLKRYPEFMPILEQISNSKNPVSEFIHQLFTTIICGLEEKVSVLQMRKDLYPFLSEIDLGKLWKQFSKVQKFEHPKHINIISGFIRNLQFAYSKHRETSVEKLLKAEIRKEFRKEYVDSFPLEASDYATFREFDDVLVREGENLILNHVYALKIAFETVDMKFYEKVKNVAEALAKHYEKYKVEIIVVSAQFTLEVFDLNSENRFNPQLDLREIQLNISLDDGFKSHIKRLINDFDL